MLIDEDDEDEKRDSSKQIKKLNKKAIKIKDIKKGGEKKKREKGYACKEIVVFCLKVQYKCKKKRTYIKDDSDEDLYIIKEIMKQIGKVGGQINKWAYNY